MKIKCSSDRREGMVGGGAREEQGSRKRGRGSNGPTGCRARAEESLTEEVQWVSKQSKAGAFKEKEEREAPKRRKARAAPMVGIAQQMAIPFGNAIN